MFNLHPYWKMKRLQSTCVLLISTIFFGLLLGCSKEDSVLAGEAPTLTVSAVIVNGDGLSNNGSVIATDTIDFSINVTAPAGFNSVLIGGADNFVIPKIQDGATLVDNINYRVFTTNDDGGAEPTFIFVAEDDLGQQSDSVRFSFSITSIIDSYQDIILGGFENPTNGSFYASIENNVHTLSNALFNAEKIDFLSYHTSTLGYVIASVDDSGADATLESQVVGGDLDDFSTRNTTRFRTYSTSPNFNSIRTTLELENAYSGNTQSTSLSNVAGLSNNDIIGFALPNSRGARIGLLRVNQTAGTTGSDRTIRFDVKIQPE